MKSSIALITTGITVLVLSVGTYALTRPTDRAGQAATFEQALSGTTDPSAEPPPPGSPNQGTATDHQKAAEEDDAGAIPRFTIGHSPEGPNRVPVSIRIPAIDQEARIIPAGVETNGDMEVPDNLQDVAWYKYGAAPGEPGSSVLAAHVDLAGRGPGVFFELRKLEPGSVIYIDFADGTTGAYRAEARTIYDKDNLPTEAIFSRQGPPVLTLITCGGDFNSSVGRYDSNVVVYAVPVDIGSPAVR